jgi:hypothetical protein
MGNQFVHPLIRGYRRYQVLNFLLAHDLDWPSILNPIVIRVVPVNPLFIPVFDVLTESLQEPR